MISEECNKVTEFEFRDSSEFVDNYKCLVSCDKFVQESEKSEKLTSFSHDSLGFVKLHEVDEKKLNGNSFKNNTSLELQLRVEELYEIKSGTDTIEMVDKSVATMVVQ